MWAGTIGFIFPITSRFVVSDPRSSKFSPSKDEYWVKLLLRWISAALLALHHVNTRNASIVGRETLSRIPEDFTLAFKLADSKWSTQGAAEAIMGWTSCQNQIDFLHDACHFLKDENGSYVNTAPHIRETCGTTVSADTSASLYEAPTSDRVNAIVGVPSSPNAKIVSTIADLHRIPVMSFAAVDGMLEDKSIYPRFSRTNVRTLPTMRAVVGVVKYFGWDAINVVNSGSSSTLRQTSELLDAASAGGLTVASTHVFSNLDPESIEKSILSLSRAMYNASSTARTRVTVLIAGNLGNVRSVLEYGVKHKVIQAGFVWLNVDGNNMQNVIATNDMTAEHVQAFTGWLNMCV